MKWKSRGRYTSPNIYILAFISLSTSPVCSAELRYDYISGIYSITDVDGLSDDLTFLTGQIKKEISDNVYLTAEYGAGSLDTRTTLGDIKFQGRAIGAGYHAPFTEALDGILEAVLLRNKAKIAGFEDTANGYGVGAGIRAQVAPSLEGTVMVRRVDIEDVTDTNVTAQIGVNVAPNFQLIAGTDFESEQTMFFGIRLFY